MEISRLISEERSQRRDGLTKSFEHGGPYRKSVQPRPDLKLTLRVAKLKLGEFSIWWQQSPEPMAQNRDEKDPVTNYEQRPEITHRSKHSLRGALLAQTL
jgi:hypothetical protein